MLSQSKMGDGASLQEAGPPEMLMNQGCEQFPHADATDILWCISKQTVTSASFKELCKCPGKASVYRDRGYQPRCQRTELTFC